MRWGADLAYARFDFWKLTDWLLSSHYEMTSLSSPQREIIAFFLSLQLYWILRWILNNCNMCIGKKLPWWNQTFSMFLLPVIGAVIIQKKHNHVTWTLLHLLWSIYQCNVNKEGNMLRKYLKRGEKFKNHVSFSSSFFSLYILGLFRLWVIIVLPSFITVVSLSNVRPFTISPTPCSIYLYKRFRLLDVSLYPSCFLYDLYLSNSSPFFSCVPEILTEYKISEIPIFECKIIVGMYFLY